MTAKWERDDISANDMFIDIYAFRLKFIYYLENC
jgi:hypothetical protein